VSPDGAHVYVASYGSSAITAFARAPLAGRLTFVQAQRNGLPGPDPRLWGLAVSPDGLGVGVRQICGYPCAPLSVRAFRPSVRAEEAASFQRPSRSASPRPDGDPDMGCPGCRAPFETRPEKMAAPQGERSRGHLHLKVRGTVRSVGFPRSAALYPQI